MISREKVGKLRDSVVKGGKTAVEIARPFLAEDRAVAKAEDGTPLPSRLPAWFVAILSPLRPAYREVLGHACFTNILALVVPLFTLQVYDRVVAHNSISTLWALVFGVILALGCDWALRRARARMLQAAALKIDAALGRKIYAKLSALPLARLEQHPTPYWLSIFQDAAIVRTTFSGGSAALVTDLPFAFLFLGVICVIAWPIVGVLVVAIPAFLLLTWYSTRLIGERSKIEAMSTQAREKLLSELITGRATVKALAIDRARQPEWEERHAQSIRDSATRGEVTDDSTVLAQTLTLFTTVMMVVVGALAIIDKELTMGGLIAANMLASRILMPLNQLLGQWKMFAMCKSSLARLDGVFALEEERTETTLVREKPKGFLTAEQLSFTYPNFPLPLLNKLDFALKPGEMVGLVGKNGCGKTTMLKLLQGLYAPSHGRVLIDGADIQQFTRNELSSWIGYVPQECFLFSGTLKDNIAISWPDAPDEAILRASKLAGADRFITDLPNGYATEAGEAGSKLSGGQRQRLAIARALIRDPSILLLDEVTSHLDMQAELELRLHLHELAKTRLVVVATHSMALLQACTRILVVDNAKLALDGPAAQVIARISGNPQPGAAA